MSSNKTRNSLARQWELLKILPARSEGKSAAEIKEGLYQAGYSISKRQVERDLLDLQEFLGWSVMMIKCPTSGAGLLRNLSDFPAITLAEALSLVVVEETLKPLLPISIQKALQPKFLQAHSQLAMMGKKSPTARWVKKVKTVPTALPLLPPVISEQVLEEIQTSLLLDEQIRRPTKA